MLQDFIHKDEAIKLHDEAVREYLNSEHFKQALSEYAQTYAQARFDEAMVKPRPLDSEEEAQYAIGFGWNTCRQEIINNWNAQSKE